MWQAGLGSQAPRGRGAQTASTAGQCGFGGRNWKAPASPSLSLSLCSGPDLHNSLHIRPSLPFPSACAPGLTDLTSSIHIIRAVPSSSPLLSLPLLLKISAFLPLVTAIPVYLPSEETPARPPARRGLQSIRVYVYKSTSPRGFVRFSASKAQFQRGVEQNQRPSAHRPALALTRVPRSLSLALPLSTRTPPPAQPLVTRRFPRAAPELSASRQLRPPANPRPYRPPWPTFRAARSSRCSTRTSSLTSGTPSPRNWDRAPTALCGKPWLSHWRPFTCTAPHCCCSAYAAPADLPPPLAPWVGAP